MTPSEFPTRRRSAKRKMKTKPTGPPAADPGEKDTKQSRIVLTILRSIEAGRLKIGDAIPSITAMGAQSGVGRDTVVKAYASLKAMGVVEPLHGKGYFVATDRPDRSIRTLVMFDTLFNGFKERVVQGLRETGGERLRIDFFSHNFNDDIFCGTLLDKQSRYERLVVMPYESKAVKDCLAKIDQTKLILLDIDTDFTGKACAVIRQGFDKETERALESEASRFAGYKRFELVFPPGPVVIPEGIRSACTRFCRLHEIPLTVTDAFHPENLTKGTVYLVIDDNDLVSLVKEVHRRGWSAGREVGLVSYNDTAMKEIVEGGVTVVSTDFHELGAAAARRILGDDTTDRLIPTRLIVRKTL